ncbi:hypothetical protein HK405_015971, partial [Cladochytrium tenue]
DSATAATLSENLRRLAAESRARRPFCKHSGTCTGNALRGFVRSFGLLYAVKYGLSFVPALITGQIYKKYRGKSDALNSFLAGTVAGASIFLDTNRSRRLMIALYLSTRTVHFLCRWLWMRHLQRRVFGHEPHPVAGMEELRHRDNGHHNKSGGGSGGGSGKRGGRQNGLLMPPPSAAATTRAEEEEEAEQEVQVMRRHVESKILKFRSGMRSTAGVIIMMISSSQILNAYLHNQETLN